MGYNRERPRKPLPTQAEIRALLRYEPDTGRLFWKATGREAFTWRTNGYLIGKFPGHGNLVAHRIIFKYVHGVEPPMELDHINGVRTDNRITNLRAATASVNRRNAARPRHNTSGVVGVYYRKDRRRWFAHMSFGDRTVHIGCFATKEEAAAARKKAERENGFHANHGRVPCTT